METTHPPTPEELWGDCTFAGWDLKNKSLWNLWLKNIAMLIIFAEQNVIDRVTSIVRETIDKIRDGQLSAEEAVKIIRPNALITEDEWEVINSTAKQHGKVIMRFYEKNNEKAS